MKIVHQLAKLGAYGVNLHDNDLVPIDASPADRDRIVKDFKAACRQHGARRSIAAGRGVRRLTPRSLLLVRPRPFIGPRRRSSDRLPDRAQVEHGEAVLVLGYDVRRFHADATRAGYRSNGEPGERPRYHAGYYAAFVLDPDGNNIEVVDHHR